MRLLCSDERADANYCNISSFRRQEDTKAGVWRLERVYLLTNCARTVNMRRQTERRTKMGNCSGKTQENIFPVASAQQLHSATPALLIDVQEQSA